MALSKMMQHYLLKKEEYPDTILFYRLGDFYEMFFQDAEVVSGLLSLTLTGRDCGDGKRAPMCGIPAHAAETYIAKLIELGYKVAICEQLTEAEKGKMVDRDVIRVITPGTLMEDNLLSAPNNNFICSVTANDDKYVGLSWMDMTTGEFCMEEFTGDDAFGALSDMLASIRPNEVIANSYAFLESYNLPCVKADIVPKFYNHLDAAFEADKAQSVLCEQLKVSSLNVLDCADMTMGVCAAGALVDYLLQTQKRELSHINKLQIVKNTHYMHIDINTKANLEVTESLTDHKRKGSLLWVLDETRTTMGARMLHNWVEYPLQSYTEINARLDAVEELVNDNINRENLTETLRSMSDIERLCGRASYGNLTPRNCVALKTALVKIPRIKEVISGFSSPMIVNCKDEMSDLTEITDILEKAFIDEPPLTLKEGGFIKQGFDEKLDEYIITKSNSKKWLTELEAREKELTGVRGMKICYNRITGYYFEVPKNEADKIPFRFQRAQTLATVERFTTPDLKKLEESILFSEESSIGLETAIFNRVREKLLEYLPQMQQTAKQIATLDALLSLAQAAIKNNYIRPEINEKVESITITDGRHPIVERISKEERFVPNDTLLNDEQRVLIITGPNMAGKSTYMRQVALITLMAHIGSFVPASEAKIALTDRIFTRIGASDKLSLGQSTFMVEMIEVANIIQNATDKSLLILDEIGRGTSTYDGLSIAWAVIEHVVDEIGARTLFATHYHELIALESKLKSVKNYRVLVKELNNSIVFLRKIVPGSVNRSFGIEVAELAGISQSVIQRAKEVLREHELEEKQSFKHTMQDRDKPIDENVALVDELLDIINEVDLNNLTPLEALSKFAEIKNIVNRGHNE